MGSLAEGLAERRGFIRHWLRDHLDLRVTPTLDFRADRSMEHAAHIQSLLRHLAGSGPRDRRLPADARAFGGEPGRALMLGHVHPDADVLGTLLALGLTLSARGWRVTWGAPAAPSGALDFLRGSSGIAR